MRQVHFCSGSVFVTGDDIAMSLLRFVQAVSSVHRSAIIAVPCAPVTGPPGEVTLMINEVSQISADRYDDSGPEFEDEAFVRRLDVMTEELRSLSVIGGDEGSLSRVRAD